MQSFYKIKTIIIEHGNPGSEQTKQDNSAVLGPD